MQSHNDLPDHVKKLNEDVLKNFVEESSGQLMKYETVGKDADLDDNPMTGEDLRKLKEKAAGMIANKESEIANAGEPIEERRVGQFLVRHLPVDEVCNRISIGTGRKLGNEGYISFRGDPRQIEDALKRAWKIMREFNGGA